MVRLFGDAGCRNSQRALKWLQDRNFPYQFTDIRKAGMPAACLSDCVDVFGWRGLIDGRTVGWRALPESVTRNLDRTGAEALIAELPQIVKSPIICVGDRWLLGWNAANKIRLLGHMPVRGGAGDMRAQVALAGR